MNNKVKRAIITSTIIILVIVAIIATFFIVGNFKKKAEIETVAEIYSDENVQERLNNNENESESASESKSDAINNLLLQIDDESVVGVIKIEKIGFEGLIYEGTSLDTLKKGVGHLENSPYLNGNVCLAAHNTNKFWANLNTLQMGDKITYISFLGTKEYQVSNITKISETDWTLLQNTDENFLTLITCVKGDKPKRLCVQAIEVK